MSIKIVTNNHKMNQYCINNGYDSFFVLGLAQDTLFSSREFILKGWKLAVDPLAGYLSRPNPYHSVFLQDNQTEETLIHDILRVEYAVSQWQRYTNIIKMTPQLDDNYSDLDYSLAKSTMEGIMRTPTYHECY